MFIANHAGEVQNGAVQKIAHFTLLLGAAFCILVLPLTHVASATVPAEANAHPIPPEERIDINHATIDELMKAPGMTHSWAGRILRFRPYWTKQDLLDRGIVTSQVYDRIKEHIIAHRDKQ